MTARKLRGKPRHSLGSLLKPCFLVALVLTVLSGAFMLNAARADGVQTVATFRYGPAVLALAIGEEQGVRTAAIVVDHPWPAKREDSANISKRIVVVFDKQTWITYERMWRRACFCLSSLPGECSEATYTDAKGTRVSMFAFSAHGQASASQPPAAWAAVPGQQIVEAIRVSVTDRDGNHLDLYFPANHEREMSEAVQKVSDYLASKSLAQSTSPPPEPFSEPFPSSVTPPKAISVGSTCKRSFGSLVRPTEAPLGPTVLSLKVEPDGTVKDVTVVQSSGDKTADRAATECAASWRYVPATQNGQPVEVLWKSQINWHSN
jgi:TonB family protein